MNKKVLSWVIVLLASLVAAAVAAVWLIVAGVEADLNPAGSYSPAPWIALALPSALAAAASLVLLRTGMTADGSLARQSFVPRHPGAA